MKESERSKSRSIKTDKIQHQGRVGITFMHPFGWTAVKSQGASTEHQTQWVPVTEVIAAYQYII